MRRLLTVLLLALAAAGVMCSPASAHNVLIGSDPEDGATLTASPAQVTLVFDQAVRQGYAQVGVTGADGSAWADGSAVVAAERVSVKVKPLPAGGSYVVGYRILSADGHPVTGKISFTVAAGASGVASGAPVGGSSADAAEAAANGGAGMAVVWVVGALLVLAAGTAVALRRAAPAAPAAQPSAAGPSATGTSAVQPSGARPTAAQISGGEAAGAEAAGIADRAGSAEGAGVAGRGEGAGA
ncbi:copper resistance protein CopC [Nonomuraea sp. PA05]|uniref:copper resistance CopC family protein n=1 Tax=Nonomuraea sp. PA05 TaxID=2604466 RepID=UPI0011D9C4CE|nr:copper resistance CopC family protein [Nonomuraea sp. PA05]TYB68402.1 copper resistance protein CopC [Nonomuraea sp. PA05]